MKYVLLCFFSLFFLNVFSQQTDESCGFPSIYFDAGSSLVKDEYYYNLAIIADFLQTNPSVCLVLNGFDNSNQALAAQRVTKTIQFFTKNFCLSEDRFVTYTSVAKSSSVLAWTTRRVDFSY